MSKRKTGHSKKSKDWFGRPVIEHFNSKGEKTSYSKPSKTFWGTPITEHFNSKGKKTGYNKKSETFWGTPRTDRYNSEGEKTGYNKKSETFWGTPITERYNSNGEKTGYSAKGKTFWGTPITEHFTETPSASSSDTSSTSYSSTQDDGTWKAHAARSHVTPVWTRVAGCVAGFVFAEIAGPIVAQIMLSVQAQPAQWLGACGVAWLAFNTIFVGVFVTGVLSGRRRMAKWAAAGAAILTVALTILFSVAAAPSTQSFEDKLIGSAIGSPTGIRWTHALGDRGAVFSAVLSSRIEYPGLIPREGTLEFWIKVDDGYHYENYYLKAKQNDAMIFSSDAQGGDVTWPGTTKIFVGRRGRVSLWMATNKYNQPAPPETEARNTKFRFGEWHAIGVSYGKQGQYIMLDGKLVASAPSRTQTFGVAGNHQQPLDIPTIGETVSHFWSPHRYEGGFEGTLAAFRVSAKQEDWALAKGLKRDDAIRESASRKTGVNKGSQDLLGRWEAKDGIQFVEFFPDNRCTRTALDIQGKSSWKTIKGQVRIGTDGGVFCAGEEGGDGVYFSKDSNTVALDYGMGGQPELFLRAAASNAPAAERFVIHTAKGDVAVIDFRKHPVSITEDRQTVEIENNNDFQIVSNAADDSFIISINVKPFPVVRKEGEAAFLRDLGISQDDACKLSAYEGTTIHVDPQYAGQSFALSFCTE